MRFPRMHIAASVVNGIMNVARDLEPVKAGTTPPPELPETSEKGAQLDLALSQPVPPLAAPADADDAVIASALEGEGSATPLAIQGALEQ